MRWREQPHKAQGHELSHRQLWWTVQPCENRLSCRKWGEDSATTSEMSCRAAFGQIYLTRDSGET